MALLLHRLPPALVTLAGDQAASAALVTCVSLAPCATEASCLPGLGLLWVLGRWQPFPAAGGAQAVGIVDRGVASATLGDGQMEGRRCSALGRGACDGEVLPPPRSQLLSRHQQGSVGSSGGQRGPSLPLSAGGTVPDTRSLGEQEHRADLISL